MPLLTEAQVRSAAAHYRAAHGVLSNHGAQTRIVSESAKRSAFDIFLSHSFADQEMIVGLYELLSAQGLSVYVDWITDPQLDRANVTPETADRLRTRMRQSTMLVYAASNKTQNSRWMPWELGYFDGLRKSAVVVLPVVQQATDTFTGQEYLGLYPQVTAETVPGKLNFVVPSAGRRRLLREVAGSGGMVSG